MTISAAPLPHPLSLDGPDWARSAATAVLGSRWPAGDESATWDVADRWYALAEALSGPRMTAFAAADQILAGMAGAGIAPDGFREAWERLSADDDAPLNALVQIAAELGQLVEECGREIEAAKLAAWVEVGTVLTELAGLSVAIELTLGAARPAADGLIAAGRVAVEQIFDRLVERIGREAATRAAADELDGPPVSPPARPMIPAQQTGSRYGGAFEQMQREEYAGFLSTVAGGIRANLAAVRAGAEADGDQVLRAYADQIETEAALVRSRPGVPTAPTAPEWARDDQTPAEVHPPGGLRPVDPVRRKALEDAVPQGGDDRSDRRADPRVGLWFSLLNAGGPSSDPTRGLNCLDSVLAFFETYQRGRPRVAGARAFDGYAHGSPDRPVGGEWSGVRRIQRATRSEFQNLCPFVGGAEPGPARAAIDAAFRNLANHLHNSGHGAFAFILTDLDAGGCHAWAAVNQGGTILFLDPQLARLSIEEPLYRHHGYPSGANVVSIDALVVDGRGEPAPLPYHGAGQWTTQALVEDSF